MVLAPDKIQTIYQLAHINQWSLRKVARHLELDRATVKKYFQCPVLVIKKRQRSSKLDPFRPQIQQWLAEDPRLSGVMILTRLRQLGYPGGHSILDQYLAQLRPQRRPPAFVRVEVAPGQQFEADWADCGAIDYGGQPRRLYAFCLLEAHSRLLYLELTHAMTLPTLCRCHLHAFHFFGGLAREILYDNMRTVVAQRQGRLVGFNLSFLDFARQMGFVPKVCQPSSPWQKGKIERAIGYVKTSFLPGRPPFASLADTNRQARQWLEEVANQRLHRETRQKPAERFQAQALLPLPSADPDYRDTITALVGKDLRLHFDGNRYCVPSPWVGCRLTVKANSSSLSLYDKEQEIVSYPRGWGRGETFGAERFEKELLENRPRALYAAQTNRLIQHLGPQAESYLQALVENGLPLERHVAHLLELVRQYEAEPVQLALEKAHRLKAWGAEYIANLLYQQASPRTEQPPVILKDTRLAQLAPDPVSLLEYDALILNETEFEP
jgi:transposase